MEELEKKSRVLRFQNRQLEKSKAIAGRKKDRVHSRFPTSLQLTWEVRLSNEARYVPVSDVSAKRFPAAFHPHFRTNVWDQHEFYPQPRFLNSSFIRIAEQTRGTSKSPPPIDESHELRSDTAVVERPLRGWEADALP